MTTTYVPMRERCKVDVPEGECGTAKVERFVVSEEDAKFANLRACFQPGGRGTIYPGTYTRLSIRGRLAMSDTPDEIRDHSEAIRRAKGRVLVHGLGLGMAVGAMLEKPEVEHVTVVEINADVIALVGPHYRARYGDRLAIIHADAFEWKPPKGVRFDVVWHDIWSDLCGDNLEQMATLHRRYGRRAEWQGSWCRSWLRAHAR